MFQHTSDDAFAGGDVTGQTDDVLPGPFAHEDSSKVAVSLFYLKKRELSGQTLKVSAAIERSFQADFSAKLQPDLPEKPALAPCGLSRTRESVRPSR
jgi:hypothetical protein